MQSLKEPTANRLSCQMFWLFCVRKEQWPNVAETWQLAKLLKCIPASPPPLLFSNMLPFPSPIGQLAMWAAPVSRGSAVPALENRVAVPSPPAQNNKSTGGVLCRYISVSSPPVVLRRGRTGVHRAGVSSFISSSSFIYQYSFFVVIRYLVTFYIFVHFKEAAFL